MIEKQMEVCLAEFERFWERLAVLPAEVTTAFDICDVLSEATEKTTYLVAAKADGQRYILKIADHLCKENLEEEYALLKTLSGNGFPTAIAYWKDDIRRYLLRQYVEGVTLSEYIEQHGVFSEYAAASIASDLCNALERLHSMNPPVIHRDLKPQNIIYSPQQTPVLIDLGAVRRYHKNPEKDTVYIGSEITAAPEQFGYRQTDVRSDIYALGVLILYLCTGSYDLARCGEIRDKHLAAIVRRCTRFDPANRYPSIHRVRSGLNCVLSKKTRWLASFPAGLAIGVALGATMCFFVMRSFLPNPQQSVVQPAIPAATVTNADSTIQPVVFQSRLIETAVRQTLGIDETTPIYESDLDRVTQLLIMGDTVYTDWDAYTRDDFYQSPKGDGTLFSMQDITMLKNLHVLGIADQKIYDLSVLRLTTIEKLVLSDDIITDLSPLSEMPCLSELYLNGNPISDISVLDEVPTLTLLDIGSTNVTDLSPLEGSKIWYLNLLGTPISDYSTLLEMPQLETLKVNRLDPDDIAIVSQLSQLGSLALDDTPTLTNLDPVLGMKGLYFLDLVNDNIVDISGVEQYPSLGYFCLVGDPISDLTPLPLSASITGLNITGLSLDDYSFIVKVPALQTVYCDAKQKAIIEKLPDGDKFTFIVS